MHHLFVFGVKLICWVCVVVGVRCYFKGSLPVDMTALLSSRETIGPQNDAISATFYIYCSFTCFFIYSTYRCLFYLCFSLPSSSLLPCSFFIPLSVLAFLFPLRYWNPCIRELPVSVNMRVCGHLSWFAVVCSAGEHAAPAELKCISSVQLLSQEGKLYIGLRCSPLSKKWKNNYLYINIYIYIYIYTQYFTKVSTPLTFRQSI